MILASLAGMGQDHLLIALIDQTTDNLQALVGRIHRLQASFAQDASLRLVTAMTTCDNVRAASYCVRRGLLSQSRGFTRLIYSLASRALHTHTTRASVFDV